MFFFIWTIGDRVVGRAVIFCGAVKNNATRWDPLGPTILFWSAGKKTSNATTHLKMAAQVVRRIGRQSRAIELTAEGPVVPIPEAMAAAREAVRADAGARQLGREPDTITTAIVTLE